MNKPYELIFWGPGDIGGVALREAIARPDFDVVGALVYSPAKDGADLGTLMGGSSLGVNATTDKEAIFALDADCVLHTPRPPMTPEDFDGMTDDIVRLLESGKNVITVVDYFYPPMLGPEIEQRINAACQKGGSSLHGSGINPGFMLERVGMTTTGLMTQVDHLRMVEIVDLLTVVKTSPLFATVAGFGFTPEQLAEPRPTAEVPNRMYRQMIGWLAHELYGAKPEDIRFEHGTTCVPASERFVLPELTVEPGTALTLVHTHRAYLGDHHFYTNEAHWYLGPENCPFEGVTGGSHYIVEAKGKPVDIVQRIDIRATTDVPATTAISAVPPLLAVPWVVHAEAGPVYHESRPHYATDLRDLYAAGAQTQT